MPPRTPGVRNQRCAKAGGTRKPRCAESTGTKPAVLKPAVLGTSGPEAQEAAINARNALVGGGSAGIGYAVAEQLLRSGHRVVITGRRAERLESAALRLGGDTGGLVHALVNDVSEPKSAATALDVVESRYGALDVLVLNAGGPPPGRVLEVEDERWQQAFELLLLGPLRLARLALPRMAAQGFGRVVFVTSAAVRQPQPDLATSVVLRSALTAAAKLLSREFAAEGVTVNCVAPGATATERRREILDARARITEVPYEDLDAADAAGIPAGGPAGPRRSGRP